MSQEAHIAFCTIVKSMRGHITPDNCLPLLDKLWAWSKATMGTPEKLASQEPAGNPGKNARITVRNVELRGEGMRTDGNKWRRYVITDSAKGKWSTFHHNVEVGETYDIEYDENEKGRTIKELTHVSDSDDSDLHY